MKPSTKAILTVGLLATAGLGGLGIKAIAQKPSISQQHPLLAVNQTRTADKDKDAEINDDGNGKDREDNGAEEQQEAAKLESLAKITPQQAQKAAETANGGRASSVELEEEDGSLVYKVAIGQKEIVVDPGNGRVLYTENTNQEDEQNEASRPRSSIQVPSTDGDVNDDAE